MPRFSHLQLYQVHIADGFSSDCDEIVHRCMQIKNLDFKEFSKVWKSMNFDLLYQGRSSNAEIAELSEELIHIAKYYMVKDTSFFEESVIGLFIVYSLVNLQPFAGFACLRLTPSDVKPVNRIEMVARRERKLDVLFILGEVLVKWTQYHAIERPRGMELVIRKYLEGYTSMDKLGVRPRGVFYRQNEELDRIRDLGSAERQYKLAKKSLFGEAPDVPSLKYINENLAGELNASLRKLISGIIDDCDDMDGVDSSSEDENKIAENRSRTVVAIKEKAMSNAVDPMNHLICADERKKTKTSPKAKSDLKSPTGKVKTGTHTKVITTSPAKRKQESKQRVKFADDDGEAVLDIEMFQKSPADDNDTQGEHSAGQDTYRRLSAHQDHSDSLPFILRPGDLGDDIEIQIVDHAKAGTGEAKKAKSKNMDRTAPTSSSEDDEQLSVRADQCAIKTYKKKRDRKEIDTDETVFQVKKKEKREQIRREIKSKFKRLGMLPIANFEDANDEGRDK